MFRTIYSKKRKQWNGATTDSVFNPHTSLGNVILSELQVNGSRVAQICAETGKCTTFNELHTLTIRVAKRLRNVGLEKGEVVFFVTDNTSDIPALVFAALCLGCVITARRSSSSKLEHVRYLSIVWPKYVFCDLEYYAMMKDCLAELKIEAKFFTFDGQSEGSIAVDDLFKEDDMDLYFVPTKVDGITDTAFIFQTSGTTGIPKAARFSHAAILDKIRRLSQMIGSTDVVLGFERWYVVTGLRAFLGATLNGSTRIVNEGSFSPERFFDLVERYKVTFALGAAHKAFQLLNHPRINSSDLSSVKHYTSGGVKTSFDVIQKVNEYLKGGRFCHNYGMTETFGIVAINLYHSKNNSAGQLISGCEAKIVNEHGERLGVDEDGELCIKQTYPFLGFVGNETTNHLDGEGFLATGDIAHFDQNGDLFITRRKKELFKCYDYHVMPTEIEEFLNKIDGVQQSCVVPIPNPKCGYIPAAVIVKTNHSTCNERSIYDAVANTFSEHKRLEGGVYFVDSLPVTDSGKIVRHLVAKDAVEFYSSTKGKDFSLDESTHIVLFD
ncbi:probable 4-coumarate--CoA ligase 1 [Sitodiplosis mosellana]|uniref:probable 4-coumarate--CoA ligase 1 n=1 Tax=Sitodiplosis mosellana TaxID=263140 RepID=UPI00244493F5|nr:probable 4-coumarate--CoA ligase 1 [Sitodiplosis mosellana]